jgi:hypothetical protein
MDEAELIKFLIHTAKVIQALLFGNLYCPYQSSRLTLARFPGLPLPVVPLRRSKLGLGLCTLPLPYSKKPPLVWLL